MSAVNVGASGTFGKLLASTEKSDRDKAVRAIGAWLRKRGEVSDQELAKLWKGIFYCYWLSDKPKVQHQLADKLAKMSVALPPELALKFLHQFWLTMIHEWHGIDRLRMDKFYFLCRRFLRHNLQMLLEQQWDENLTETFVRMLESTILDVRNPKVPDGLRYHSAESFLEELGNCYRERTDKHEQSNAVKVPPLLFRPFITAIAGTRNSRLRDMVQDEILAKLFAEPAKLEFDFDRLDLAQLINMVANGADAEGRDRLKEQVAWAGKALGLAEPAKPTKIIKLTDDIAGEGEKKKKKKSRSKAIETETMPSPPAIADESNESTENQAETEPAQENVTASSPARAPAGEPKVPATERPRKRRLSVDEPGAKREKRRVSWGPNATKTFQAKVPLARFGMAKLPVREIQSPKKPVLKLKK